MRAERDRRAAILTAEGVKQSQILTAEGEKQSAVLRAEGAKQAAILRAEGEAKAIDTVFQAIHEGDPDPKLLSYQYLQMLPAARARRREQDLGHPERVHAGAVEPRGAGGPGRAGAGRGAAGARAGRVALDRAGRSDAVAPRRRRARRSGRPAPARGPAVRARRSARRGLAGDPRHRALPGQPAGHARAHPGRPARESRLASCAGMRAHRPPGRAADGPAPRGARAPGIRSLREDVP